jgi:hypothetical protein
LIPLTDQGIVDRVMDQISTTWRNAARNSRPLVITLEHSIDPISTRQRRRYWALLRYIQDACGQKAESLDLFARATWIGYDDAGEPLSLGTLNIAEANDLMRRIEAWAAMELGIEIHMT